MATQKTKHPRIHQMTARQFAVFRRGHSVLRVTALAVGLLLAAAGGVPAASVPRFDAPAKAASAPQPKTEHQEQKTEGDKRGTKGSPFVIDIGQSSVIKIEATDKTERQHDYFSGEWWLVYLTAALVLVTLTLALYTALLYRQTKRLATDAEVATKRQAMETEQALALSKRAADAASANTESLKLAERAYVKVTLSNPGVRWNNKHTGFFIDALIKNYGRTPASITDVWTAKSVREHGDLLPLNLAEGPRDATPSGILVPGEDFSLERYFGLAAATSIEVKESAKRLWVYGHVDYIDTFGNRHRAGFARMYEPVLDGRADGTNFILNTERRYDYDRPRQEGEGTDWAIQG